MPNGAATLMPPPEAVKAAPKQPAQVYLNENVLMGMVLSTVEVFKKECFGMLLGYRADGKYIVEHAIPYQSVRRGHNWTELRSDKWKIMQGILRNFPKLDILGDYHSHTMYRDIRASVTLSEDDIAYMEPHELQIVVAINQHEHRRAWSWSVNADRTLSGWIDRYHFRIAAYYYDRHSVVGKGGKGGNGNGNGNGHGPRKPLTRPRMAQILCPIAMGAVR
ncbi:MAG TPA: Mov34/MPN/PAD-1 family protein [Nitrospiria bacterium]|nr:Mov34/MPN/PAD-1 family protein [Nitrospiria bacterium]